MKDASSPTTSPAPGRAMRVAAPVAALVYPGLVWGGTRISLVVLALSLVVPVLAAVTAHRIGRGRAFPVALRVAHLAVAAPPLFSLLGGWLDFQHAIPINDLTVWIPLWSVLAIAALLERPITTPADPARARRVAMVHGCSAAAITVFVAAHVVNHLAGLFGGDTHLAIMSALRTIYRHRLIEPVLIGAVLVQLVTGFELLRRKLARPARWFDTLQTVSGGYLLVFLLSHTSAVFRARLRDVDTNWTWLSGGELLTDPWSARLVPYYFLAVIAFAVHGACGLRTVALGHGLSARRGEALVAVVTATSVLASALILIGLFRS